MAKLIADVRKIVLAYGSDKRNQLLNDPKGDEDATITPALAQLSSQSPDDFARFFFDFTEYIRVENAMPDVIMTKDGLISCDFWADLVFYIFNLQISE